MKIRKIDIVGIALGQSLLVAGIKKIFNMKTKAKEVMDEYKANKEVVEQAVELCPEEEYNEDDYANDVIIITTKLVVNMVRFVVLPIVQSIAGTYMVLKSVHSIRQYCMIS